MTEEKKKTGRKRLKTEDDRRKGITLTASKNEIKRYGAGNFDKGMKRLKRLWKAELGQE
jgi:hypothetical protein